MKSRLSSTIWIMVVLNAIATLVAVVLAYNAVRRGAAGGGGIDASGLSLPGVIALGMTIVLAWRLGGSLLAPVDELADFSERLGGRGAKGRGGVAGGQRRW